MYLHNCGPYVSQTYGPFYFKILERIFELISEYAANQKEAFNWPLF